MAKRVGPRLRPGQMIDAAELARLQSLEVNKPLAARENPCLKLYGQGDVSVSCRRCRHLEKKRYPKTHYKCGRRETNRGTATDHWPDWPSCKEFKSA